MRPILLTLAGLLAPLPGTRAADAPAARRPIILFVLADDLGETKNLAAARPVLVKELSGLIDAFLKGTGAVVPKANPASRAGGGEYPR